MPIRPENRSRYPKDWKAIAASIRERAGNRCEGLREGHRCITRQYAVGKWAKVAGLWRWQPECGSGPCDAAGQGLDWPSMQPWTYAQARQWAGDLDWAEMDGDSPKPIVIVLTVAHLDHTPENCSAENLRALCQRCHLEYDHDHHRETAAITRRMRLPTPDMFLNSDTPIHQS